MPRYREQSNMLRPKPDFFVQLSIHRLFWRFAIIYAPLRELPRVLPVAPGPEYLAFAIADHYAYIGTKTVAIYHAITRLKI